MPGTDSIQENGDAVLPLRPALRVGNENANGNEELLGNTSTKAVSIAEEPETITPKESQPIPIPESKGYKQFKTNIAEKRMTGRPTIPMKESSRLSLVSQSSWDEQATTDTSTNFTLRNRGHDGAGSSSKLVHGERERERERSHHHHRHHAHGHESRVINEVYEWLQGEKAKRAKKKGKSVNGEGQGLLPEGQTGRRGSAGSESSATGLEKLQKILEDGMAALGQGVENVVIGSPSLGPRRPSYLGSRRKSSARKLGAASSDTEYQDGDLVVPSCDVVLDNSKTMSYSGGVSESPNDIVVLNGSKRAEKEKKAWHTFKSEIVKLAHTLRLKGWRRVPLERGGDIEVERLSGALTNAVYVVSPPKDLPFMTTDLNPKPHAPRPPPKLLLRIYGPQVEHLIDRENELGILRRLARKKIGPRLLGTFKNGRFEEFFNAQTLKAADLRIEDTSKQIAKRMRELHDGIELLEREREEGPFVFRNWDKWVDHCQTVITYLDKEILSGEKGNGEPWRSRGLVCGVEWPQFKAAIDKYRKWLEEYYGKSGVNRHLVFAHNDTQYGNILRLIPETPSNGSAPSPLLLPQNTHKQLVVIDFEYASANTLGLEFANHFTEWCYNYHDPLTPWRCNTNNYPTLTQQERFIRSYVNHRPQFNPRASATPKMDAMDGISKGSISEFLLDSRTPGGISLGESALAYDYKEEEAQRERETERQVQQLLKETRIWRVANSAQWVAWGIVQAKVPELDGPLLSTTTSPAQSQPTSPILDGVIQLTESPSIIVSGFPRSSELKENGYHRTDRRPEGLKAEAMLSGSEGKELQIEGAEAEEEEFDYLAYAQDRAMFFWGDVVGLGIVKREELPESLWGRLKVVDF